ncbi:MAG: hypothetical protein ABW034_07125 [Steroidobacteraceae bacterium]
MTALWLLSVIAFISLAAAIVDAHLEREIVNDEEDELALRVRWRWK